MKKTLYLLLCVCLIFSLALSLAACGKAEFTVTFKVGDEVHDEQLVKEGESATAPEEPTKAGYAFDGWFTEDGELWDETDAITENVTLSAKFSKADYTATFKADGKVVATKGFNVDTTSITAPTVPAKVGYTGAWESFSLGTSDITVNAVYTPIEYTATFKNGDDVVGTVKFTVETTALTEPAVPSKTGYDGAWESYTLGAADITVNSVYTPTEYTATFMSGTDVVSTVTFTVETKSITAPTVPVKNGYHGAWESFVLGTEDITVNAVYTLGEYVAIFKDGNTVVATEKFTYDNTDITVPAVPTKPGYESAWQNYTLGASNITINAIHTPIEYTATFKDGDVVVGTVKFTVETETLNAPAVPDKFGYVGSWENYYIGTSDMVINAVYTPGEYTVIFVNNGIEIGRDTYTYADLTVTEPT